MSKLLVGNPAPAANEIDVIAAVERHKETVASVISEALAPLPIVVLYVVLFA